MNSVRANIPIWLFNSLCVIAIAALVLLSAAAIVGITNSLEPKDGLSIVPLNFSVGSIDETGKILNADNRLYTDTLIECTRFRLTRDFNVYAQYEIHFYDKVGKHIDAATVIKSDLEYVIESMPEGAVGIRLVVIPNETNVDLKSWGLLNFDRIQYASMLIMEASNEASVASGNGNGAVELTA